MLRLETNRGLSNVKSVIGYFIILGVFINIGK